MKHALLVIDVQQFFINTYTKNIPMRIKEFIDKNSFDFVIFFRFINEANSNWYKSGWKKMMTDEETHIVVELQKYMNKKNTFSKTAFSVFASDEFKKFIKEKNVTDLYICGLDTHACVYATTLEAYSRGYNVHVIEDLCGASHGDQYHTQAIDMLKKNLGTKIIMKSSDFNS